MIVTVRSNRIETLAEHLARALSEPLSDPLTTEVVVVQNPGMGQWLALSLARDRGILANVDFALPARIVWSVFRSQFLKIPDRAPLEKETLVWRIFSVLGSSPPDPDFSRLARYVESAPGPFRRFELSRKIADLFDQYLVYRPDWILDWEEGTPPRDLAGDPDEPWQGKLWRTVARTSGESHRAHLFRDFAALHRDGGIRPGRLPERITLFAPSSLVPSTLGLFAILGAYVPVTLYLLDPSPEYWGLIRSEREKARLVNRGGPPGDLLYRETGNPLLASWGTQTQEFFESLHQVEPDDRDCFVPSAPENLLSVLQSDIYHLVHRGSSPDDPAPLPLDRGDRSFRVHLCHSPAREIEVLHDHLLDLLNTLPDLHPRDILVMAPRIDRYLPFIEAVFGTAPGERRIPFNVPSGGGPVKSLLWGAILWLLDLPLSRVTATEVQAFVHTPSVRSLFGWEDPEAPDRLEEWIRGSGIRWGTDSGMRREEGFPDYAVNTWEFGLSRLLLGYTGPPEERLFRGVVSGPPVSGTEAVWLGSLAEAVGRLGRWRKVLGEPADLALWQTRIAEMLDDFFLPGTDQGDLLVLQSVREALADLLDTARRGGFQDRVDREILKEELARRLEERSGGLPFRQGVTFGDLASLRGIPSRVVWILGMNDGDFPKSPSPVTFDLMAHSPRTGDRSRRNDDRLMVLEALLAARDAFVMSAVGQDNRDNSLRSLSVVLSELLDTVERSFFLSSGDPPREAVTVLHPLQPFSRQNFGPGPGGERFSYAREWIPPGPAPELPFCPEPLSGPDLGDGRILLADLQDFYRHPGRHFLRKRLEMADPPEDGTLSDSEPFVLDPLESWQLADEILSALTEGRDPDTLRARALRRGTLPPPPLSDRLFDQKLEEVREIARRFREELPEGLSPLSLDLECAGFRLQGTIEGVGPGGAVLCRAGTIRAKDKLALWITHLLLSILGRRIGKSVYLGTDRNPFELFPVADPEGPLATLVQGMVAGRKAPVPIFPQTGFRYAEILRRTGDRNEALEVARKDWTRESRWGVAPSEGADRWNSLLWRGVPDPLDASFEDWSRTIWNPVLDAGEPGGSG